MADLEAIKTQLEDVAKSVAAQIQSVTPSPPKPEVPSLSENTVCGLNTESDNEDIK